MDKLKHAAYRADMDWNRDIDAIGLLCPLPVLRAAKELRAMSAGETLRLRATDPAAVIDVPHFCAEAGHRLAGMEEHGTETHFFIEKR